MSGDRVSAMATNLVPATIMVIVVLSALSIPFGLGELRTAAGAVAAMLGLACVVRAGGMVRLYTLALSAGSLALLMGDADLQGVGSGLNQAGLFCAFLAGLYALRSAVETSPALAEARRRLHSTRGGARRGILLVLGWLFSIPLAVGAVSVLVPLLHSEASEDERVEAATWGIRGLSLSVLCSPFTVAMGLVTSMLPDIPLTVFLQVGFPVSLAALVLPMLTGACASPLAAGWRVWAVVGRVLAPVAVLVVVFAVSGRLFGTTAVETAVLLVAPFAVAVAALGGAPRLRAALEITRKAWSRFDSEVAIFVSALVFAALITRSPTILHLVDHAAHLLGPGPLVVVAMLAVCALSAIGIHMAVPGAISLSVLGPLMPTPTAKVALGFAVLLGWSFGVMTAPGSIAFLVVTRMFAVPPARIAFGRNLPFMGGLCLLFSVVVVIVL